LFFMSKKDGDEQEYQTTIYTDDQWEAIAESDSKYRTNEVSDESEYRVKLDYTLPISEEIKFEAGYQAKIEKEDETYDFEEPGIDDIWNSNPLYKSSFHYSHNLHSLYTTFSHEGDGFSYQVGLRGEYADRKISSIQFVGTQRYEKLEFFPTLHFSQKLKHNLEFQASYSRRLQRPDARDLEPFASFIDQYNIRIGNPNLKPEFTNSYEITILKRLQKSFISVDGYYRTTNDLLTRSQSTGDDGIIYYSMDNINNDYSIGSEIMANLELKPGFRIIASGTLYNYRLKGEINGKSVDQSSTNFDSRLNLDMKLAKNTRLQLTGIYSGSTVSAQGTRDPIFFANAAIKQDFFNNSLTATLQLQDIFGTMKYGGTSYSDGYSNTYKYQRESQVLQLTLSYKINNFKNKPSRGGDGSSDSGSMGEF